MNTENKPINILLPNQEVEIKVLDVEDDAKLVMADQWKFNDMAGDIIQVDDFVNLDADEEFQGEGVVNIIWKNRLETFAEGKKVGITPVRVRVTDGRNVLLAKVKINGIPASRLTMLYSYKNEPKATPVAGTKGTGNVLGKLFNF